jgi:hypothetical protein
LEPFKRDYPDWDLSYEPESILQQIHDHNVERWSASAVGRGS